MEERLKSGTDTDEFTINPVTGMLVSHGQEHANTPRVREQIKRANKIRSGLPALQSGYVRLWRGHHSHEFEVGRALPYTNSLEGIALPAFDGYGVNLSYIDVPEIDLGKYPRGTLPNYEFILPAEVVKNAVIVSETK